MQHRNQAVNILTVHNARDSRATSQFAKSLKKSSQEKTRKPSVGASIYATMNLPRKRSLFGGHNPQVALDFVTLINSDHKISSP
jgi:hypothetical protein